MNYKKNVLKMRFSYVYFILVGFIVSCSNEKKIQYSENMECVDLGSDVLECVEYYPNRKRKFITRFKDGKQDGSFKMFNSNGGLIKKSNFRNGIEEGGAE